LRRNDGSSTLHLGPWCKGNIALCQSADAGSSPVGSVPLVRRLRGDFNWKKAEIISPKLLDTHLRAYDTGFDRELTNHGIEKWPDRAISLLPEFSVRRFVPATCDSPKLSEVGKMAICP
jgi:hypothetical protein